jgi:alkylated DNA repair dioxygenase AlkB
MNERQVSVAWASWIWRSLTWSLLTWGYATPNLLQGIEKKVNITADLFSAQHRLQLIPMQDAEVYYQRHVPLAQPPHIVMSELIDEVPWRAENIVVWGRTYPQPRLIAWYGDVGKNYTYSGIKLEPLAWTHALLDIKSRIEVVAGTDFNSVLLNYYRDQRDSMGLHSDDEPELGEQPIIASLSLGEERIFILKHKRDKTLKPVRLKLAAGSILLMKGDTQRYWKHGIDKETRPCGPRVNLTFRRILI